MGYIEKKCFRGRSRKIYNIRYRERQRRAFRFVFPRISTSILWERTVMVPRNQFGAQRKAHTLRHRARWHKQALVLPVTYTCKGGAHPHKFYAHILQTASKEQRRQHPTLYGVAQASYPEKGSNKYKNFPTRLPITGFLKPALVLCEVFPVNMLCYLHVNITSTH